MVFSQGLVNSCPAASDGAATQIFLTLVNALMSMRCELEPEGRYPPDNGAKLQDGDEFDFIVVGAGSAGCVVANRLSEVQQWKILLMEAGGYPSATTEIPAASASLQDTDEDWQYLTESSKTCCLSLKHNRCRCPRGKGLGGSSLLNTMLYTRSTRYDHERWFQKGNDGWDYNSIVGYYKKHENAHIEDNYDYGGNGELHLTRYTSPDPIRQILGEAYQELGYTTYTEENPTGFRDTLVTIYKGTRMSSSKAYLAPIKDRKNLVVALNAHMGKLLLDKRTKSVQGVQVKIHNKVINIKARKEVILSAGSINTPIILMNSGIGPQEHLTSLGIETVKDLRVGNSLQDHFSFGLFVSFNGSLTTDSSRSTMDDMYEFFERRQGALSTVGMLNFLSCINTHNKTSYSNVQYFHKFFPRNDPQSLYGYSSNKGIPSEVVEELITENRNNSLLLFIPVVLHPKSHGHVRIQNSDPYSKPLIIPNYLSDEHENDIEVLLDAIKFVRKLIGTQALSNYDPKFVNYRLEDCKKFETDSDEFWKCVVRNIGSTSFHPAGTCKMGPASDSESVVNPQLQVHGIKGVRVMDGSIMPTITSGNLNAPIMMIGEKGADLVKKDWLK